MKTLRQLAEARGVYVGAAVVPETMRRNSLYADILANEFNELTAENAMKFAAMQLYRG